MMKRVGYTLLFLLFASCYVHAAGPGTLVGTYYYPWYTSSNFHVGAGQPTGSTTVGYHLEPTQVLPALGWYDQDDASVISQHYDWARYASIDFFVCSYWGSGSGTDNCIRNRMFNNPDRGDVKLCVFMEPSITPASGPPGATEPEITAETNYLCDNYFNHPCYLHIDGKPVIFIYVTRAMSNSELTLCINAIRTAATNKGIGDVYIVGDEVWGYPDVSYETPRVNQMDAISNYDVYGNLGRARFVTDLILNTWGSRNASWKSLTDSLGKEFIPGIAPGYNDRTVRPGSDNPACSRKLNDETNEFGTFFSGMIDRITDDTNMVVITSWNEWHEDTQIEPTTVTAPTNADDAGGFYTEGLYYEGYGTRYLHILREQFVLAAIGATASGEFPPDRTADKAFDGNVNTKWLDFSMIANGSSWIQWRYADGRTAYATEYAITSANNAPERDPMDWNLLGSNDGGDTWDTLDSRTGEIFASRFQRRNFLVSIPGSYNIYRLEITAVYNLPTAANSVQLAEFGLCAGLADFNCNGIVSVDDSSYMAGVWLTADPTADIAEPADGIVSLPDFSILSQDWLNDPLTDGIVAYWKLDGDSTDSSFNGFDGTLYGNPVWDPSGRVDGALDFDGDGDYVKITGWEGIDGANSRTVCAWVKTEAAGDIVSWGEEADGKRWLFYINSVGGLRVDVYGGHIKTTGLDLRDGTWHHVAALLPTGYTNVTSVELYVDGIKVTNTSSSSQTIDTGSVAKVRIGVLNETNYRWFNGLIDDVRIYNRALSQDEIENIAGL